MRGRLSWVALNRSIHNSWADDYRAFQGIGLAVNQISHRRVNVAPVWSSRV